MTRNRFSPKINVSIMNDFLDPLNHVSEGEILLFGSLTLDQRQSFVNSFRHRFAIWGYLAMYKGNKADNSAIGAEPWMS